MRVLKKQEGPVDQVYAQKLQERANMGIRRFYGFQPTFQPPHSKEQAPIVAVYVDAGHWVLEVNRAYISMVNASPAQVAELENVAYFGLKAWVMPIETITLTPELREAITQACDWDRHSELCELTEDTEEYQQYEMVRKLTAYADDDEPKENHDPN